MDYEKIGLLAGIEIHQQLEGRKLFARTVTAIRDDPENYRIRRSLLAVAGETGFIDAAAAIEQDKNKQFIYKGYDDTISLVELDEQPPLPMNKDALYTALQLATMLKCFITDEIQVMRKTVVDGSNTSGFQRTAMVGMDGHLFVDGLDVEILSVCIEEDSAKIEERSVDIDMYNLSRLGIPLVEIATGPQMKTPQQVQDVAARIGMMLRSTGRVKRGLGTIRQDVNVSIRDGDRVEIKGAQDLSLLPTLVEEEAKRQLSLVALKERIGKMTVGDCIDVTEAASKMGAPFVAKAIEAGAHIFGARITNGAGVLGEELQTNRRLGSDFSDIAKIHAGVGGIMHSDEDPAKYDGQSAFDACRELLDCASSDAFILVVTSSSRAQHAFTAIADRINLLRNGVVTEVRRALDDGTTSYLRPMPGASRMYPETDIWPIVPDSDIDIPELLSEKAKRYVSSFGLSEDLAQHVVSGPFTLFETSVAGFPALKPALIAELLTTVPTNLRRKFKIETPIADAFFSEAFERLSLGTISASHIVDIAKLVHEGKSYDVAFSSFTLMDEDEVRVIVEHVVKELGVDTPRGKLIGEIMKRTSGKADGRLVNQLLSDMLK